VSDAVYEVREDGSLVATGLSRGPWDPGAQHGGAPAAMLMRAFEQLDDGLAGGLAIGRVTYELLRPVPLGELRLEAAVVRPGRRVQLLEGSMFSADGVEVVRARGLRVARAPVDAGLDGAAGGLDGVAGGLRPAGPETGRPNDFRRSSLELFPVDAMDIRFVAGDFSTPGASTAWFRLKVPLVAGEDPSGRQRLAAAADFPNGIATPLAWDEYLFINPDLTVVIERDPVGEWICLDASMRVVEGGLGVAEAVLYDSVGRVGRSMQTLYVARRS
jgi:hypothetical protein